MGMGGFYTVLQHRVREAALPWAVSAACPWAGMLWGQAEVYPWVQHFPS